MKTEKAKKAKLRKEIITIKIEDWCARIINGTGGFISLEEHELSIFEKGRDIAIVEFVIRALANAECEGSAEILTAILERRHNGFNKESF